jgi:serine phosphatase RsbU (regulator of sigma subunit)
MRREELRKEAERVAEERAAVLRLLKDERNSLRLEKKAIRDQHMQDVESLNREREEFTNKMELSKSAPNGSTRFKRNMQASCWVWRCRRGNWRAALRKGVKR